MTTAKYASVIAKAGQETAKMMTAQLRAEAASSGWSPAVANSISVKFAKDSFSIHIPKKHKEAADAHEYGSSTEQPNRVLHRFGNRLDEAEKFLLTRVSKMLGGKI
jgi:hypothetical protein